MERNEPTTGEIIHELTALLPPMTNYAESICAEGAFAHSTYMVWDEPEPYIIKRAIDRIEQQEQRIAELEAENRDILQNSVSHTTHAEFVSDYQEQLDEKDAKIAELNDFQNSQCAKLLVRNGELERELEWKDKVIELAQRKQDEAERELAAAKEDLHHNDACSVCIGAQMDPQEGVEHARYIPSGRYAAIDPLIQKECSNCGCGIVPHVYGGEVNYCPNCGAELDEDHQKFGTGGQAMTKIEQEINAMETLIEDVKDRMRESEYSDSFILDGATAALVALREKRERDESCMFCKPQEIRSFGTGGEIVSKRIVPPCCIHKNSDTRSLERIRAFGGYKDFDHKPTPDELARTMLSLVMGLSSAIFQNGAIYKEPSCCDPLNQTWTVGVKIYMPVLEHAERTGGAKRCTP